MVTVCSAGGRHLTIPLPETLANCCRSCKRGSFNNGLTTTDLNTEGKLPVIRVMITATEEDAENERLSPFPVDGDPRYTHAVLTFILLPMSEPQPAVKFHGDDCVGLAEIDRPVSLIVVLRRQNAI